MKVLLCLDAVLICLECVVTRVPWVLDKATVSAENQFGPSAVNDKSNRAADLLCICFYIFSCDRTSKCETEIGKTRRRSACGGPESLNFKQEDLLAHPTCGP